MAFLGCQYVVGSIAPYLASYFEVGSNQTVLVLPIILITNIFVMPFGAQLAQNQNPRLMILIGSVIGLTTIFLASMMTEFFAFMPLFSIGFGICNGLTYMVPM